MADASHLLDFLKMQFFQEERGNIADEFHIN